MTVKELIEILMQKDPNATVVVPCLHYIEIDDDDNYCCAEHVHSDEEFVTIQ